MKRVLISLSLVASLSTLSLADEAQKDAPLSEANKQEMMNSDFEMPSAGDLVNALTKTLGVIDWNSFIVPVTKKKYTSNEDLVLNLGVRGADAYFLAASKDSANLISVSTEINFLLNKVQVKGTSLNSQSRKARLKELKDLVKAEDWKKVQKEITILQNNLDKDFMNGNSKSLMILNNIGGWIEGYRLAVEGFNKNYKADKTDIILQGQLISYLQRELQKDNGLKSFDKTPKLLKTLGDLNGVLKSAKGNQLTKAQIEQLLKILNETKIYI